MTLPAQKMPSGLSRARATSAAWDGAWILLVLAVLHFLSTIAEKYGHLDNEAYSLFVTRRQWLWAHLAGGMLTLLLGPFQFLPWFRAMVPWMHRWTGRIYLIAMIVGAFGATGLIATTSAPLAIRFESAATEVAWLFTALMGFHAIRARKFPAHRRWMIRNYIITGAFVTFRIAMFIPGAMALDPPSVMIPMLLWSSWIVPMAAFEVYSGAWTWHEPRPPEMSDM